MNPAKKIGGFSDLKESWKGWNSWFYSLILISVYNFIDFVPYL